VTQNSYKIQTTSSEKGRMNY